MFFTFQKKYFKKNIKLITTIDDRIKDQKLQYNINREAAKISTLSSGKIDQNEYLTGKKILPFDQRRAIDKLSWHILTTNYHDWCYIFNELIEKGSSEFLEGGIKRDNLIYKYKTEGRSRKDFRSYQNTIDLFNNLKDGNINPKEVLKNQINFKSDLGEIKKGNPNLQSERSNKFNTKRQKKFWFKRKNWFFILIFYFLFFFAIWS